MSRSDITSSPPRLLDGPHSSREDADLGRLLARSERYPADAGAPDVERQWHRVRQAMAEGRTGASAGRSAMWYAVPALAACGAIALWSSGAGESRRGRSTGPVASVLDASPTARVHQVSGQVTRENDPQAELVPGRELRSGDRLATGSNGRISLILSHGAYATLSGDTRARWQRGDAASLWLLERGSLTVRPAEPRANEVRVATSVRAAGPGAEWRVWLDGVATVSVSESAEQVMVESGRAGISSASPARGERELTAGLCWSSRRDVYDCAEPPVDTSAGGIRQLAAVSPASESSIGSDPVRAEPRPVRADADPAKAGRDGASKPSTATAEKPRSRSRARATERSAPNLVVAMESESEPDPAPVAELSGRRRAAQLAAEGRHRDAIDALRPTAEGSGARAEFAQYEIARLTHRQLRDRERAVREYRTYLQRFPDGRLSQEAELSLIELQLERGGNAAALVAIDRFIERHPSSERIGDLLRQKGHILRKRGRWTQALAVYDRAVATARRAHVIDDAMYHAALCAARVGSSDDARSRLRGYLEHFPDGRHARAARTSLGDDAGE